MPQGPLFAFLCLLLSFYAHGADHLAVDADRVERLNATLTTLIAALEEADKTARQPLEEIQGQRLRALALSADGHHSEAASLLQESLVEVKIQIAAYHAAGQPLASPATGSDYLEKKHRDDLDHIGASLEALLSALVAIGEEKGRAPLVAEISTQVEQYRQNAQALTQRGALVAARHELDQALITVKTAIAALRNRETLVRSLNFASKEEEYLYELDRYQTYAMLIRLLAEKQHLAATVRTQMEAFQLDARAEQERARSAATSGDFETAVRRQEISNQSLLKAIRRGGIYVPG